MALAEFEAQGGTIDIETTDGREVAAYAAKVEEVKDKQVKELSFLDLKKLQATLKASAKLENLENNDS